MGIETSFVAGYFHDGKKTLLNHDKTQTQTWGTWDPDHLRWDEPDTQGDIADLNFPFTNDDPILENKEQLLAIKLHQRVFSEKVLGFNLNQEEHQSEILKLDQVALLALLASDTLHKSFYQSASGLEDGPPSIMRCPFFLPFYAPGAEGRAIGWLPMDLPSDTRLPVHDLLPAAVGDAIQFRNARKLFKDLLHAIRHEKEKAINPAQFLTTRQMLKWQESFFSSFPDTTYLPITSLNFHHRFVAVLLLLVYQRLCKWRCETLQNPQEIAIPLCLNTIVCPPEVLTNRLRDTSLVRKISHRLQLRLHRYFHESQYLQPLQRFGFSHPDLIPFFFYNKDAIVLISGGADQEAIQAICREIAQKTESIITLNTIPIQAKVEMTFHKKVPEKGQGLDEINILDLMDLETRNDRVRVIGNACLGEPTSTPFLGIPKPDKTPKVESDGDAMEEAHCFACNKGVKKLFTDPFTDDRLCKRCHELRRQYRFCQVCNIYFQSLKPSQPADEPCVLCGGDADWSETTPFLRGGKEGTTPTNQEKTSDKEKVIPRIYRVAYVLIKTDASLEGVKLESEAQMSRFRHLRARFENPTNPKLIRKPAELADQEGLTAEDWKLLAKIDELLGQKTYTKNHLISELQHITGFKWELLKEKLDDYIGRGLLSDPKRLKQLVSMKPTRDTIFEYLQATLNMNQFQEDLKGQLRETLQEVQRRQANERHNFDGYPITDADWTDEALDQHVMYRSPTRTLLVMPEPALRLFYPKLLQLTQNLHLAHKLRIVACAHNTPVWWILHELKLVESEDYFSTDLKNASRDLRDLQTQLDPQTEEKNQILKVWEKSEQFRERYQQVVHPLNHISLSISETQGVKLSPRELTLTIIRGSSLRSFPNEIAHRLLTFVPLSNPCPTQLHSLAEFATQLHTMVAPDNEADAEAFRATFRLEIDARANPNRKIASNERLPIPIAQRIRHDVMSMRPGIVPAFLREIASLHKIPTGTEPEKHQTFRSRPNEQSTPNEPRSDLMFTPADEKVILDLARKVWNHPAQSLLGNLIHLAATGSFTDLRIELNALANLGKLAGQNQVRENQQRCEEFINLITRFYDENEEQDPDLLKQNQLKRALALKYVLRLKGYRDYSNQPQTQQQGRPQHGSRKDKR